MMGFKSLLRCPGDTNIDDSMTDVNDYTVYSGSKRASAVPRSTYHPVQRHEQLDECFQREGDR